MASLQELALMIPRFICSACTPSSQFPCQESFWEKGTNCLGWGQAETGHPSTRHTPSTHWITSARQTGHSQKSPEEQRAVLHKAQGSLSSARSGDTAQAGSGSRCPSVPSRSQGRASTAVAAISHCHCTKRQPRCNS